WLTERRRVIGVELHGHGHTPDTGRDMSIERFADDVAELIDRVAGGGPVDVWGYSLGALTATSLVVRHPVKVRRLVLAASNSRPAARSVPGLPARCPARHPARRGHAAQRRAQRAPTPVPSVADPHPGITERPATHRRAERCGRAGVQ